MSTVIAASNSTKGQSRTHVADGKAYRLETSQGVWNFEILPTKAECEQRSTAEEKWAYRLSKVDFDGSYDAIH